MINNDTECPICLEGNLKQYFYCDQCACACCEECYDKLEDKKKQLTQPPPIKKTTKKVVEVEEEEEEEEVIVKKQPKKVNNTSLDQEVSMLSIQQKLKLERQKMLMNTLSPMC
jgi:hypothetical protein